jgi:hypothetical protein
MATATPEKIISMQSLDAAKAAVRAQLEVVFADLPADVILKAASRQGRHAISVMLEAPVKTLSVEARNQMAATRMQVRSFERLHADCNLLEASDVCVILGVTKQALSKKTAAGHVIAYTHKNRKYFPEFQFAKNKENPSIAQLVKAVQVDLTSPEMVNVLIKFLVQTMDYSNPGEPENIQKRYALLEDPAAFAIIVRDFKNRLEMGK